MAGGFHSSRTAATAGQEDAQYSTLKWESLYTSAIASGASLGFCIKGNSAFTPGNIATVGLAVVTAPSGFARQFGQYDRGLVVSSRLKLTAWGNIGLSGTSVYQAPLVVGCVAAQSSVAITYATALPALAMATVAHGRSVTQYPGQIRPVRSSGTTAALLFGDSKETLIEEYSGASGTFAVASDPSAAWYYCCGITNIDNAVEAVGATSFSMRIEVEYRIKWFRPAATATLTTPIDAFGMELKAGMQTHRSKLPLSVTAQTNDSDDDVTSDVRTENKQTGEFKYTLVPKPLAKTTGGQLAARIRELYDPAIAGEDLKAMSELDKAELVSYRRTKSALPPAQPCRPL